MKQSHKILHLVSSCGFYGVENVILEIAKFMAADDSYHPVVTVIKNSRDPHTELVDEARKSGIETAVFDCQGRFDKRTVRTLRNYILGHQVDLVHSHQYKANFYTLAATRRLTLPRITTCHLYYNRGEGVAIKLYDWLDKRLVNNFDRIVATSELVRSQVMQRGINSEKVTIVNNGVKLSRFETPTDSSKTRRSLGLPQDVRVVGTVGRLWPQKNHALFIDCAKRLVNTNSKIVFLIVGEGYLRKQLERRIDSYGLGKHVVLCGAREGIPELLAVMDVFALPSLGEGLPMALLEAMAARKPVIATPVGAVPHVIRHDHSGLLAPPKADAFAEAIAKLLDDHTLAARLAKNGYKAVAANHTNETMARKYCQIYDHVLAKSRPSVRSIPTERLA